MGDMADYAVGEIFNGEDFEYSNGPMDPEDSNGPAYLIKCPYCDGDAVLADCGEVYKTFSGKPVWLCRPCNAFVGCHPGTNNPLGTLANAVTRTWRANCHAKFDRLWKSGKMNRAAAYRLMRKMLDIPADQAHIGLFDEARARLFFRLLCEREARGEN